MYQYAASVIRVVDGDTVWLRVDLGFRMFTETDFRLARINAPELHGDTLAAGQAAKDFLSGLIVGVPLTIKTGKPDNYGRWLVEIVLPDGRNVNDLMLSSGNAVPYGH